MFARRLALVQEVKTTSHPGSRQDRSSLTKISLAHCSGTQNSTFTDPNIQIPDLSFSPKTI